MAKVSRHQLAGVVADMSLERGAEDKNLAKTVAAYLLEERRVNDLESLLRDVQRAWAKKGHVDVLAKVARALDDVTYQDLARPFRSVYPEAQTLNVTPVVDPSLMQID